MNTRVPDGSQPGDDLLMMQSPSNWPNWPVLPLKKRTNDGSMPPMGLLYDMLDEEIGIDNTNRFRFLEDNVNLMTLEKLRAAPAADLVKLIADGWIVD